MNTDAHTEEREQPPVPARLRGLWGEACEWVAWLLHLFDRDALRSRGLKRATGARLNIWLTNIEGALRRLVLAAALAVTPPASRRAPCAAARVQPGATSVRRPGFRVFRIGGAGAHAAAAPIAQPRAYGHIVFPSDPLLCLGVAHLRAPRHTRNARQRNPLDRWGRLSRRDPDWRPPEGEMSFFEAPPSPRHAQDAPRPHRTRDPAALPDSLHDWRRHHDEWERLVPAPQLAARLEALGHVMAHPGAAIARAARRLRHVRETIRSMARDAAAMPGPPRRATHIETAGHTQAFASRCHAALVCPDTS